MPAEAPVYAIVPVKHLSQAKTRLADGLTAEHRERLCLAMLEDVLDALNDTPAIDTVGLYTSDATAQTT